MHESETERLAEVLAPFGERFSSDHGVSIRLASGATGLAPIVRALDAEGVEIAHLQLHQPTLDDVFLAKTGRSLEGAADEAEPTETREPAPQAA